MRGMHNTAAELQKFHISLSVHRPVPRTPQPSVPSLLTLRRLHTLHFALFQCNRLWLICCYLLSSCETLA